MNTSSTFPSTLVGRVYHNISKCNYAIERDSKKRPRPWDGSSENCSDSTDRKNSDSSSYNFHKGFIFVPDELSEGIRDGKAVQLSSSPSYHPNVSEFQLVVPFRCLRATCYAAATGQFVQISKYSLIRYRDGWGDLIFSSRPNENNDVVMKCMSCSDDFSTNHFIAIEVHLDSLCLVSSENEEDSDKNPKQKNDAPSMNLETLAQKEARKQQSKTLRSKKKKSTAFGKDPMNITGVVDAISPILVNDSQEEPFAIMELYKPPIDEAVTDVKSAVAVIRGEKALCIHPAIHPGQSISLVGVVSRKWKVPSEFQKHLDDDEKAGNKSHLYQRLNHRVPDRVILVTEARAIHWNDEYESAKSLASSSYEYDLSLPSTVESLTSIRGIVKSVHYHQSETKDGRKARHVLHFVTLKLLIPTDASEADKLPQANHRPFGNEKEAPEEQKLARIYLPKYAIPPNLILGMQPGTILRAVNIHFISPSTNIEKCESLKQVDAHYLCYVACLRSTLTIERCAGESYHHSGSSYPWFVSQAKPFLLVPDHRITDICSDPFNTKSSAQYLAGEKLRCELESKLMDVSSTLPESSDVEYAQRPIYDADCHDSKSSDQKKCNPHSISTKVDILLTHHHRNVTCGKLNHEKIQSKGCSCIKRKSNRVNGGKSGRLTMRDPYAEFFDHAHSGAVSKETECGSVCNDFSCYNHYYHSTPSSMPLVVGLDDLRNACAQNFINRVQLSSSDDTSRDLENVSSGWTSSHHYYGLNLCQVLNGYARSQKGTVLIKTPFDSINIYTWGNIKVNTNQDSESAHDLIHDNACALPLCEIRNEALGNDGLQAYQLENHGSPTWMQMDSVIVSCLCLGSNLKERVEIEESYGLRFGRQLFPYTFLPSMLFYSNETDGHGFVFLADNLLFIGSVHIAVRSIVSMDRSSSLRMDTEAFRKQCAPHGQAKCNNSGDETNTSSSSITKRNALLSIQECLEHTTNGLLQNSVSIVGRLMRKRFKFRKAKYVHRASSPNKLQGEKYYEGWTIILSHNDPFANDVLGIASALQTVELKISVPLGKLTEVNSDALKLAVLRLLSSDSKDKTKMTLGDVSDKIITPDQATMGLAWWVASEDSRTLPLLSRGWDEFSDKTLAPSVFIKIPFSARTFSKLGYQRFRCDLKEIKSFFAFEPIISTQRRFGETAQPASLSPYCRHGSEFRGSEKFLPGMLNRRLHRVPPLIFKAHQGIEKNELHRRNRHSLLTWLQCEGGVPSVTLAQIHWDLCASLKDGDHAHMKPSLLRRIHNAKILGISFCRARVECTQCFQVLTSGLSSKIHPAAAQQRPSSPISVDKKTTEKSILFCPSGCSRSRAAVKWECSAIIDDGTGQAKLYAEREAALLLLGGSLDVASIEIGAWDLDGGVFFQPALPASSHLMQCIKDATAKSRRFFAESKQNKKEKIHNEELPSTFSLLPADAKSEYLIHKHCRQWYQQHHHRKMDLFCRCKPLSEDVTSVNQSEIQVAKAWIAKVGLDFGTAPTASLPPLKLTLEDACLASEESYDDNTTGWNLLKNT